MTVDMDFSGSVGEWQRNVSEGSAGKSRRLAVIEALDVRAGQAFLDMGCGEGRHSIGALIETHVNIIGLDLSIKDLNIAKNRLNDFDFFININYNFFSISCKIFWHTTCDSCI